MKRTFKFKEDPQTKYDLVGCHIRVTDEGIPSVRGELGIPPKGIMDGMIIEYDKPNDMFKVYWFANRKVTKWEPEHIDNFFSYIPVPSIS